MTDENLAGDVKREAGAGTDIAAGRDSVCPRFRRAAAIARRGTTKPIVGIVVALLSILVMAAPIPLGNVTPALVIVLISLAYLEEDGLLLGIGLLAAVVVLAATFAAVWETVRGAAWLSRSW